jgi:hypothetical protein
MMKKKRGDHKRGEKEEARGGELCNSQPPVQIPSFGNGMSMLQATGDILSRAKAVGKRKGLPCTITPEEVRRAKT